MDDEIEKARQRNAKTDSHLRQWLGYGSLVALVLQLAAADAAFYLYGHGNQWRIPPEAIDVWLGAAVLQVALIVQGLVRYLFPPPQTDAKPDVPTAT